MSNVVRAIMGSDPVETDQEKIDSPEDRPCCFCGKVFKRADLIWIAYPEGLIFFCRPCDKPESWKKGLI